MTALQIAEVLQALKGITPERVRKAKACAARFKVEWSEVLAALSESNRELVRGMR